jgi:hypothetical protein
MNQHLEMLAAAEQRLQAKEQARLMIARARLAENLQVVEMPSEPGTRKLNWFSVKYYEARKESNDVENNQGK